MLFYWIVSNNNFQNNVNCQSFCYKKILTIKSKTILNWKRTRKKLSHFFISEFSRFFFFFGSKSLTENPIGLSHFKFRRKKESRNLFLKQKFLSHNFKKWCHNFWSNCHIVYLPFCQVAILSTCHFGNLLFCHITSLSWSRL